MTLALVTGGAGFIGSQVVAALTERGWDVRILDSAADKAWRVQDSAGEKAHRIPASFDGETYYVELIQGDIRDRAACDRALAGVTLVLHQAAKVGLGVDVRAFPDYTDVNATGTASLLAAMASAGVRSLVLASSMVVYGEGAYTCPEHGPVAAHRGGRRSWQQAASTRPARPDAAAARPDAAGGAPNVTLPHGPGGRRQNPGATRGQGASRSISAATPSSSRSPPRGATSCTANGVPVRGWMPAGTETAG